MEMAKVYVANAIQKEEVENTTTRSSEIQMIKPVYDTLTYRKVERKLPIMTTH